MLKKIVIFFIVCFLWPNGHFNLWAKEEPPLIRKPIVSGKFYSSDKEELSSYIKGLLSKTPKQDLNGKVTALIIPHAGYAFSAGIAAYAYKAIEGLDFDTVIIVGLSHQYPITEISLYPKGKFETPLGLVEIDESMSAKLMQDNPRIKFIPEAHQQEHSLEVQLPFLQVILKKFKIVPILIDNPNYELCQSLASSLANVSSGKKVLLIASTDMSHYPNWSDAYNLDLETLKILESFDTKRLAGYLREKPKEKIANEVCILCSEAAVLSVLLASKDMGADTVTTLKYANSGDVSRDKSRVVGYGALAITKSKRTKEAKKTEQVEKAAQIKEDDPLFDPKILTEQDKKDLLYLARQTILQTLKKGKLAAPAVSNPNFSAQAAVFVTLWENHTLRGCVGQTKAVFPLSQAIINSAYNAAFEDMRFTPVQEKELDAITIEISILSPMERIKSADKIKLGTHGVYVRQGNQAGIFLPEVATQTGWSKEEFLSHLCKDKAGLPANAWKDPKSELYIFTVSVFKEEELNKNK